MDIKLRMPTTEDDCMSGINDGNIETFRNKMMLSLTKEELQNSTDNAIWENGVQKKVTVEFHDFFLPTNKLPEIETLIQTFNDERAFWDAYMTTDKKVVQFFDRALSLLQKDKIRCLRISDFNTTGLTGVKSNHASPWLNLVKNRGVSDKPTSATGSFGIGKDAAFACSDVRTVFYNTVNTDATDNKAFQGTLKLPTYKKNGKNYTGFGAFVKADSSNGSNPLMENVSLDPDYVRNESGMDKYIIGFLDDLSQDDLKREIIASSINNFLCAFWDDKLVLKYGDVIVDKAHLDEIIEGYKDSLDPLTLDYYKTLKAPDKEFYISVFEPNDVSIYIRLIENAGRRAAIVRKSGMKVFDKGNISRRIEFSAVVVLTGEKANGYFKALENPEHTGWSLDRVTNKNQAKVNQNKIFDALREAVSELQQSNATDAIDADGMNEYLPFAYVMGRRKKIEGLSNEVESKKKAPKKKKGKKPSVEQNEIITYDEDEQGNIIDTTISVSNGTEGGSGNGHGGGGDQSGNGEGSGNGTGGTGTEGNGGSGSTEGNGEISGNESQGGKFIAKRRIPNSSFRFAMTKNADTYHLFAIGDKRIKSGFIEIRVSSETDTVAMPLSKASIDGKVSEFSGNKILFGGLEENIRHDIAFDFKQVGEWAIEVSINEN